MVQDIITIALIAASFGYAGYRIFRFFHPAKARIECAPDKCSSCPYSGQEGCGPGGGNHG